MINGLILNFDGGQQKFFSEWVQWNEKGCSRLWYSGSSQGN